MRKLLSKKRIHGLSLVEILVVLGLFSGIATLSLATLFNTQAINVKLLQSQSILDNVNLSLQTISREIRYGTDFYCSSTIEAVAPTLRKSCPMESGGGASLSFQPPESVDDRDRVTYFIANGVLYKKDIPFIGSSTVYQMTSLDIYITQFKVFVSGANTSVGSQDVGNVTDFTQPLVSLFVSGRTRSSSANQTPTPFYIQTHISTRILDNS